MHNQHGFSRHGQPHRHTLSLTGDSGTPPLNTSPARGPDDVTRILPVPTSVVEPEQGELGTAQLGAVVFIVVVVAAAVAVGVAVAADKCVALIAVSPVATVPLLLRRLLLPLRFEVAVPRLLKPHARSRQQLPHEARAPRRVRVPRIAREVGAHAWQQGRARRSKA